MKIIAISEAQARRSWDRLLGLQQHGFIYLIKRRGKVVARASRPGNTISWVRRAKGY